MNASAKGRHIASHLRRAVEAHIADQGRDVARNLCLLAKHDAPSEGGHVAGRFTFDIDRAAEAGEIGRLLVCRQVDVAMPLGAVVVGIGKGSAAKQEKGNDEGSAELAHAKRLRTKTVAILGRGSGDVKNASRVSV